MVGSLDKENEAATNTQENCFVPEMSKTFSVEY